MNLITKYNSKPHLSHNKEEGRGCARINNKNSARHSKMIDVAQWRASVGSWQSHRVSVKASTEKTSSVRDTSISVRCVGGLTSVIALFFILLLVSGDIEVNPGPKTGNNYK